MEGGNLGPPDALGEGRRNIGDKTRGLGAAGDSKEVEMAGVQEAVIVEQGPEADVQLAADVGKLVEVVPRWE